MRQVKRFIATGAYLGLIPIAPGSFGALWGVALHLVGAYLLPRELLVPWLVFWLLLISWANHVLTPWAVEEWKGRGKKEDPGQFILDEIAGYLVVPIVFQSPEPFVAATFGFLLFRILDIIKIDPARWIDRNLHGSWGILLDDLVSGSYAAIILWLFSYLAPGMAETLLRMMSLLR